MDLNEFQREALRVADYPGFGAGNFGHCVLGLSHKVGAIADWVPRVEAQGVLRREAKQALVLLLGDLLWWLAAAAAELDLSLDDLATAKLRDCQRRAKPAKANGQAATCPDQ